MPPPEMTLHQQTWNKRIEELKSFIARFGHGNVTPQTEGYSQLGSWVNGTRHKAKYGKLSAQQTAELNAMGFLWSLKGQRKSSTFDKWIVELRQYVSEHGNCNVTPKTSGHEQLGAWVSSQRVR